MGGLKRNPDKYIRLVMAVLAIILIGLFAALIQQYLNLRQAKVLNENALWLSFANRRAPLPAARADVIQPWMTFDYVNRLFGLPAQYLESVLKIASVKYPHIPLYEYAAAHGQSPSEFSLEVQKAVAQYQPTQ